MKVINVSSFSEMTSDGQKVAALGLFEAMHVGHLMLLKETVRQAKENNLKPIVVTVSKPVNKGGLPLFDINHRAHRMADLGIEEIYILEMNDQIRMSTKEQFIEMLKSLGVSNIICGADHRFGHLGKGSVADLQAEFTVTVVPFVMNGDQKVSTTAIKKALAEGNIAHANSLLGYNYYIIGEVKQGKQLGRTIGVPTANIYPSISPLATGAYLTRTTVGTETYRSITNIGYNPTVGDDRLSIETYIGDQFNSDIYGHEIKVEMIEKIRDEYKFSGIDELVERLKKDIKYMEEQNYENY